MFKYRVILKEKTENGYYKHNFEIGEIVCSVEELGENAILCENEDGMAQSMVSDELEAV